MFVLACLRRYFLGNFNGNVVEVGKCINVEEYVGEMGDIIWLVEWKCLLSFGIVEMDVNSFWECICFLGNLMW